MRDKKLIFFFGWEEHWICCLLFRSFINDSFTSSFLCIFFLAFVNPTFVRLLCILTKYWMLYILCALCLCTECIRLFNVSTISHRFAWVKLNSVETHPNRVECIHESDCVVPDMDTKYTVRMVNHHWINQSLFSVLCTESWSTKFPSNNCPPPFEWMRTPYVDRTMQWHRMNQTTVSCQLK